MAKFYQGSIIFSPSVKLFRSVKPVRSVMFAIMLAMILVMILTITNISLASSSTMVWYIPHPDDETIGMADAIHRSVREGNTNYFVYFTRGGASQVRYLLRGPDGQSHNLSKEELKEARVRETMAALEVLGAKPENILFLDFPDSDLTLHDAIQTISFFVSIYPDATHCTTSVNDPHSDHRILAQALNHVNETHNNTLSVRYYNVYVYKDEENIDLNKIQPIPVKYRAIKKAALEEFSKWDPDAGRYAIGYQSVPDLIAGAYESKYEYVDIGSQINMKTRFFAPIMMRVCTSGVGLIMQGQERLLLGLDYHYGDPSLTLLNLSYRIPNRIPLIHPKIGIGYSLSNQELCWITTARFADYYFVESIVDQKGNLKLRIGLIIDL